jgi:hypothetical protein
MSLYEFNLLSYERQLVAVFDEGTFLARRWEEEDGINLYHLPGGVFVEIYYDTHANEIVQIRATASLSQLEDYTGSIRLPKNL